MKPPGALSKKAILKLALNKGQPLYKVYSDGDLDAVVCTGKIERKSIIKTVDEADVCHIDNWFQSHPKRLTFRYIFDNYFHALAYSLKLKAEHEQTTKPKERTGMAGAP